MQVEFCASLLLTVDEEEKFQRQKVACLLDHVFQLTYTALLDLLIHKKKVNCCNGCAVHHPSQRKHSCLVMDNEDAWSKMLKDSLSIPLNHMVINCYKIAVERRVFNSSIDKLSHAFQCREIKRES